MIGSLLYLCASRPDIMLSVCMCARFQANPKEAQLTALKRILRYLVYTPKLGLWYPRGSAFDLIGYSDADWAGCKINRKSTSGTCQFLGRSLVSWASKKQNSVALSTAKAEYIAAGHCCAQLLWMRQTLRDYGYKLTKVPLLCDNESAIRMADNPVEHSRTKHIAIRYHFLRDHQQKCRRFDPGGSLDRRVNCRRVSQPRWVGARRSTKGGKETSVKGKPATFVLSCA
jgi:hypothetical protein